MMAAAGALVACADDASDAVPNAGVPSCPSVEQQALVAGTPDERYLGITDSERRAIVKLVDGTGVTGATCTGTFVSPTWVVTAAHCLVITGLSISIEQGDGGPGALFPVARTVSYDGRDLALVEVDFAAPDARVDGKPPAAGAIADVRDLGVVPIAPSAAEPVLSPGDAVELAGFGDDAEGASSGLNFVVEAVVAIETTKISVNGFGTSGACVGDSGGPLLLRARGSLAVRGVLSTGAVSCRGLDRYVRLDDTVDWIRSLAGEYAADERGCGTIDERGRCLYGTALYCAGGELESDSCEAGTQCGWDADQQGFRCVQPNADTCSGVDAVGACRENVALSCGDAALQHTPCAPCGTCRVDSRSGAPFCAQATE